MPLPYTPAALQYQLIPLKDLARGLDLRSAENALLDGYCEDLQDMDTVSSGQLQKRRGYQGYAGYVPMRVTQATHDGYQLDLKLDAAIDLTGVQSSPLVLYGKFDHSESGDIGSTNAVRYYASFSTDVREIFTVSGPTIVKTAAVSGLASNKVFFDELKSTSDTDASNTFVLPDTRSIDSADAMTLTSTVTVAETGYFAFKEMDATSGEIYVADYTSSAVARVAGVVTITVAAGSHGLSNTNFIARLYENLGGSVYRQFLPDTFSYDSSNSSFTVSFPSATDFDGILIVAAATVTNIQQATVGPGATGTITVSTLDTSFPYWALYENTSGTTWTACVPDDVSVNAATGTMTVTITNASASPLLYNFFYDFYTIPSATVRVVDTQGVKTTYTGTTITNPQLTLWGLAHHGRYATTAGGQVTHIDAYKREAEARMLAGLGGVLYAARTYAEVASTYDMPLLYADLHCIVDTSVVLAPIFQTTGSSVSRTRGIVTGDDVTSDGALVTAATYISSGVVDYTISCVNRVGGLVLNTQVATSDTLTVSMLGHSQHTGSFAILSITSVATDSVVVRVTNTAVTTSDYDETGAQGRCNVYTDIFQVTQLLSTNLMNFIPGDVLQTTPHLTVAACTGGYSTGAGYAASKLTVSGVTSQVSLASGTFLYGARTGYAHGIKAASGTASVTGLVRGDMVTMSNITTSRRPRVSNIISHQTRAVSITVSGGVATASLGGGYTVSSVNTGTGYITLTGATTIAQNDPVQLTTTVGLPDGLRSDATYYANKSSSSVYGLQAVASGGNLALSSAGSGTLTLNRVHLLKVGEKVIIAQTGDHLVDGLVTVTSVPTVYTFTFATTTASTSLSGVLAGNTVEFDESITVTDNLGSPTSLKVNERWVPIEAPTTTGNLPVKTHTTYFTDTTTRLRSSIVSGSMYCLNGNDEVKKFDGTSLYQAGLYRWQPHAFCEVDTTTGSLTLDATSAAVSAVSAGKFTVGTGEAIQFAAGNRVIHSQDSALYTVQSVDTTNNLVYVVGAISGSASGTLKKVKTYHYYARLNMIDANNNVIASAATGAKDMIVELSVAAQIRWRLVPPPVLGAYDYDRIEVQLYRTAADVAAPYYLVRSVPVTFSAGSSYIDIYDGNTDDVLLAQGNQDATMVALLGANLGTTWEQPPRAKCITTVENRLVLANIKDYQQLDVVFKKQASAATVASSDISGFKLRFLKTSTDASTTTNMVDRVTYEFVTSGAVSITPNTDIASTATTMVVTKTSHGLVAGNWVYMFQSAAGTTKKLQFAGWFQVASATTDTFTVNFTNGYTAGATDCNRYVCATAKTDVPVWLGTDGNWNTKYGNTSGSYEAVAALRLATAINATQVATDLTVSGQSTFVPWLTANAGGEYTVGEVVVRQTKYSTTTMAVVTGTLGSNYDVYVNSIKRASATTVAAVTRLFPSRLVISYQNFPEIFDAPYATLQTLSDSIVDVNAADGEEVTATIPFFGAATFSAAQVETMIVVFKSSSIYLVNPTTRAQQRVESQGLGCTVPGSVTWTRNGIMFANLSGIYRLNRDLTITYVGKFVERYWTDTVSTDYITNATGHNYGIGRQYKLSVPVSGASTNSTVLVYDHTREGVDQELGAWTRYSAHNATGWANLGNDSYFGTVDGQVYKIRTANDSTDYRDDASAIPSYAVLKAMDAGMPGVRKTARDIVVHMRLAKTNVTGTEAYAAVDNSTTFQDAGLVASSAHGSTTVETFRLALPTPRFTHLQLKFANAVKDENFVLSGVDLYVAALGVKGIVDRSSLT